MLADRRRSDVTHVAGVGAEAFHEPRAWHTLAPDDVLQQLGTRPSGLTSAEATERLATHGPNELQALDHTSAWQIFVAQFKNVLVLILLGATIASAFLGHTLEA